MPARGPIVDNCARSAPLLERRCRWCERPFFVCASCNRGHAYCRQACRELGYRRNRRAANRRHQQSPEGREDHASRMRAYRAEKRRRSALVTDNTLAAPPSLAGLFVAAVLRSLPFTTEKVDETSILPRCVVCDRVSTVVVPQQWVDDRLYRRDSFAGDAPGGPP